MRKTVIAAVLLAATAAWSVPAYAITNGVPDAGEHPMVGELLFYVPDAQDSRFTDPGAWYTCTGTLIDSDTVVTAGHCSESIGDEGEAPADPLNAGGDVWFSVEEVPDFGMPPSSGFVPDDNEGRYDAWSAWLDQHPTWHQASASYTHPEYLDGPFYAHDVGVITLSEPVALSAYAKLPSLKYLDQYAGNKKRTARFETVGYGLEGSGPKTAWGGDTRRKAEGRRLTSLKGVYGMRNVAANFSHSKALGGGSCFGDSGGPTFDTTPGQDGLTMVTVTSFGMTSTCTTGGYYRIDQADDLAFINAHR